MAATLAGCTDDAPQEPEPPEAPAEPVLQTRQSSDGFGWALSAGVPTTGMDVQILATNAVRVPVENDAQNLTVDVTWSCASPLCDMHVYLRDPADNDAGHAAAGASASFAVERPAPGDWTVVLHGDNVAVEVDGTVAWSYQAPA